MGLTRRQFLQRGAVAAAAITAPHPLLRAMLGARSAEAAPPPDAILVVIQLEGGNDGLNTVIPIDDAGSVAQRTLYEAARPTLAVPVANLAATEIDADPAKGNRLALHPSMTDLKTLYDAGVVAVVAGGVYGTVPALNDLDGSGNLKFNVDFRQVYATIIDKWLASPGAHVSLLPGAPYTTLGFLP